LQDVKDNLIMGLKNLKNLGMNFAP